MKYLAALTFLFITFFALIAHAAPQYTLHRSVLPETTNAYYLGSTSPSLQWNGIYTKDLTISGTCTGCGGGPATSTNPLMMTYGVATSTTQASTFPYASSTALTVSGNAYFGNNFANWNSNGNIGFGSTTPFRHIVIATSSSDGNLFSGIEFADLVAASSVWVANKIYQGITFSSLDASTAGARERMRLGTFMTSTNGGLNGFAIDAASTTNNGTNQMQRLISVIPGTNTYTTLGSTTPPTPHTLDIFSSDGNTGVTAQSDASMSLYNTSATDGTFSEFGGGVIDSLGADVEITKIAMVGENHTAGAVSGEMAFLTRSLGTLAERARISDEGNFGLGTAAPTSLLMLSKSITSATAPGLNGGMIRVVGGTQLDSGTAPAGTVTNWVNNGFAIPTFGFTQGTSTATNAANLYIAGAPTAQASSSILTTSQALWVDAGDTRLDGTVQIGVNASGYKSQNPLTVRATTTAYSMTNAQISLESQRTGILAGDMIGAINFTTMDSQIAGGGASLGTTSAAIVALSESTHSGANVSTSLDFRTTSVSPNNFSTKATLTGGGNFGIATTTPNWPLTILHTTSPQIGISGTSGGNQWFLRETGGNLYMGTSTYAATSSVTAFTLNSNGIPVVPALPSLSCLGTNSAGKFQSGTCSGGGAWPFTPSTYAGVANQSTTTPLWLKDTMIIASTTNFTQASTTMLTNTGNTYLTSLGTAAGTFLAADPNGKVIATSSPSSSGGYTTLADVTLGSDTATLSSGAFTAKARLRVYIYIAGFSAAGLTSMQFNGDTGTNYARSISNNGGAASTASAQGEMQVQNTSTTGEHYVDFDVYNVGTVTKFVSGGSILTTTRGTLGGTWATTTAQVTSISLYSTGGGNVLTGSRIIVTGSD